MGVCSFEGFQPLHCESEIWVSGSAPKYGCLILWRGVGGGFGVYDCAVSLAELGFGGFFRAQLGGRALSLVARVAAEHRGGYEVWSEAGRGAARLSGRLTRALSGEALPGVGDWVRLRSSGDGSVAVIDEVLERRTVFVRGAAGRRSRPQVVAANVDVVFVVCGLDADYSPRRIQRYLARVWASGAEPVVVLSKADSCEQAEARQQEIAKMAPTVSTSVLTGAGIESLRARLLPGRTAVFVGSSGAGKSTLVNALAGQTLMATGAVREKDGRGQHTTTRRQLLVMPNGSLVIDTPGMRELQLVDDDGLDRAFADVEALAAQCRFRDCTHGREPGCAVQAAIRSGELDASQLAHFQKLKAEARANEARARRLAKKGHAKKNAP